MLKNSRKLSSETQIERLERRHSALAQQIADLDARRFLTSQEQEHVHGLKREKLATKDELAGLRRRLELA